MEHSVMYSLIKEMYDIQFNGYTTEGIKIFVPTGWITAAEYEEITGVPYAA